MANYAKMARETAERRRTLESELDRARKTVKDCEKELAVLSQIIGALKGVGAAPARRGPGRKAAKAGKRRKGGKWKKGHPGRPPKWYVEQQKAEGGGKKAKRRGRKPGRKAAAKPAAPSAPEAAAAPQA